MAVSAPDPVPLALCEDDLAAPGVIEPSVVHRRRALSPRAVICFFNEVLADLERSGRATVVDEMVSEIGRNPIYEVATNAGPVTAFHPGVGAPLAAACFEEAIAYGCTHFVACGGAGALLEELVLGHPIIVTSAVRDEGTSFHYLPPGRVVEADPNGVAVLQAVLDEAQVTYVTGRTWTTDALYRETRARVNRRVAEGCVVVEMEAAAFMAVARYRGVSFAQLLYAGDSLAGAQWDERHWMGDRSGRAALFDLAAEAALRL